MVVLTDGEELSPHKDIQNHRLHKNATISFGKWSGGVLQVLEEDKWINRDSRDQWVFLNARDTYHRVTEGCSVGKTVVFLDNPLANLKRGLGWTTFGSSGGGSGAVTCSVGTS